MAFLWSRLYEKLRIQLKYYKRQLFDFSFRIYDRYFFARNIFIIINKHYILNIYTPFPFFRLLRVSTSRLIMIISYIRYQTKPFLQMYTRKETVLDDTISYYVCIFVGMIGQLKTQEKTLYFVIKCFQRDEVIAHLNVSLFHRITSPYSHYKVRSTDLLGCNLCTSNNTYFIH